MKEYRVKKSKRNQTDKHYSSCARIKKYYKQGAAFSSARKRRECAFGRALSDDSRHFLDCVQKLGIETKVEEDNCNVTVNGHGGQVPAKDAAIYVGSAGTAARFLAAFLGLSEGTHYMDASAQMRKRPMGPLLKTLTGIGASFLFEGQDGHFPFEVTGCRAAY